MSTLSCYYLDEPLTPEQRQFAADTLMGPGATFQSGATEFIDKRVPYLLPASAGLEESAAVAAGVEAARKSLRKAGIEADSGRQVLFVIPRELRLARVFQAAIHAETGFYPYTLQRWNYAAAEPTPDEPRIIDIHGLAFGGGGDPSCSRC